MAPITKRRFDALAGYTRRPEVVLVAMELEWYSEANERVLGIVAKDRIDDDFSWVALARDRRLRYRAIDLGISFPTVTAARAALETELRQLSLQPNEAYHQEDEEGDPVDFFTPVVPTERLHPSFACLLGDERYSPARGIIAAMMRYHDDVDGNFVEQFQTTGFDARLWELYLFAVLVEYGYARVANAAVPDLVAEGVMGKIGVEAVTANPSRNRPVPPQTTPEQMAHYLQNYIPFKLAKGLTRKLRREQPYWRVPAMAGVPFLIGIQDFHYTGSMRMIVPAATEYVFGWRHSQQQGRVRVERITEHRVGPDDTVPSGFFGLPDAEHVSAVLVNPQGTLMKFNRMGVGAGFGSQRVRMTRTGLLRREGKPDGPQPRPFVQLVTTASDESWIEGMVVLHNPRALIPLHPELLVGANHEFVEPDGRIMSLLPDFHPYFSQTMISLAGETPEAAME